MKNSGAISNKVLIEVGYYKVTADDIIHQA